MASSPVAGTPDAAHSSSPSPVHAAGRPQRAAPFPPLGYLASLTVPRTVLWLYLVWYLYTVALHFEPSATLWLSSVGISAIIGTGLYLSTAHGGSTRTKLEPWQIARLYIMPFCVSSFAALIKGKGFVLVFHPNLRDNLVAALLGATFVGTSRLCRFRLRVRRG